MDSLLRKAYISKVASKNTILNRITLTQSNIDALERRNEFFRALKQEVSDELSMNEEELDCIRNVLGGRGITEDDIEFHHAVYADELVALTIADLQLAQMVGRIHDNNESVSENSSDSDSGESLEDDLVYKPNTGK